MVMASAIRVGECARDVRRPAPPDQLTPVPGTARGRGRTVVGWTDLVGTPTRRRAGVFRRALRREASRLRDRRRLAGGPPAQPHLLAHGRHAHRSGRCRRRRRAGVLGRRPHLAQRRRPVPPDRAVPPLRLRPVDAAAVRAVGGAALGRRLVRVAWRDDPAAALDDPLGVPPTAADDGRHRGPARAALRGQPRHRQHQPAADPDAVGGAVQRAAARRPAVGPGDLDEVDPGHRLADPVGRGQTLGPAVARPVDRR